MPKKIIKMSKAGKKSVPRDSLDPTDTPLTSQHLVGVDTRHPSKYVNDILDKLFSPDELLMSSVTGKSCGALSDEVEVRPPLSPNRLHAARSE